MHITIDVRPSVECSVLSLVNDVVETWILSSELGSWFLTPP